MASTLDLDVGVAPTKQARIKLLTIDFTAVTSYATGGHAIAVLTAALAEFNSSTVESVARANHDGTDERYFKVDVATGKLKAYTNSGLGTEVAATTDLSAYTAIPVELIGE